MILQSEITLDDAMLKGFRTFRKGCNFALVFKNNKTIWLQYGCYVGSLSGEELLLQKFLENEPLEFTRRIDHLVKPETVIDLMKREPCSCCGGFQWESTR